MNAKLTVEFKMKNICDKTDLKDTNMTFEEMIKYLIKSEGLFGLVDDKYKILKIEETK